MSTLSTTPSPLVKTASTPTTTPTSQRPPSAGVAGAPQALVKMAQDGLTLGPATASVGPNGKPQLALKGSGELGGVPVSGAVKAQPGQTSTGGPKLEVTGAGVISQVPVAGQGSLGLATLPSGQPAAQVTVNGTVGSVPVVGTANVTVAQQPAGKPAAIVTGAGNVANVPVSVTATVGVSQQPNGKLAVTIQGSGQVAGVPLQANAVVTQTKTAAGSSQTQVNGTVTTPLQSGARVTVQSQVAKNLNAGQDPKLQAALTVGPEINGLARQAAAKLTSQFIRSRQMPAGGLGPEAEKALGELRAMNKNGQMTGAVQIQVDVCTLKRQIASGIDSAARNTTWRQNPRRDRPGVRNAVMNTRIAQNKVHEAAQTAVNQTLSDIVRKSGGVIKFVYGRPSHTGGTGAYQGQGVNATFQLYTPDVRALAK